MLKNFIVVVTICFFILLLSLSWAVYSVNRSIQTSPYEKFKQSKEYSQALILSLVNDSPSDFEVEISGHLLAILKLHFYQSEWFSVESDDEMCDKFAHSNGNVVILCAVLEPKDGFRGGTIKFQNGVYVNE